MGFGEGILGFGGGVRGLLGEISGIFGRFWFFFGLISFTLIVFILFRFILDSSFIIFCFVVVKFLLIFTLLSILQSWTFNSSLTSSWIQLLILCSISMFLLRIIKYVTKNTRLKSTIFDKKLELSVHDIVKSHLNSISFLLIFINKWSLFLHKFLYISSNSSSWSILWLLLFKSKIRFRK